MDLEMPVLDGIEATRRIKAEQPEIAVVVLTSFSDRERILQALDAGAAGYLLKDVEPARAREGDRVSRTRRRAARPEGSARASSVSGGRRRPPQELSDREREVLMLVAEGLPNKLIARRLDISEKTVKAHLTSVFRQIGVTDRTQAALWAERHGIHRPRVLGRKSHCDTYLLTGKLGGRWGSNRACSCSPPSPRARRFRFPRSLPRTTARRFGRPARARRRAR